MKLENIISAKIREVRHAKGMSQRQLSEATGLEEKFISALETHPRHISTRTLERIAKGLNVPAAALLGDEEVEAAAARPELIAGLDEAIKLLRVFRNSVIKTPKKKSRK